ncbi:cellulase family glycosylhydrolase [Catenulispora yoronensis]
MTKTTAPKDMKWGLDYSDTLTFDKPDELATALDDAKRLGMDYIRVDFGWEDYQSFANFPPDFGKFDNVVAAANARNLKVLATIDFPPPWARRDTCKDTSACPPADNALFAKFVKQAVARYSARGVHYWEVWNEPNIVAWAPSRTRSTTPSCW